ncbi:hypothetical protein BC832DRAFT_20669 [Gaertneriomyces semiglobifer]|nr:hypothetical protein BC832DRAFT_20669 [Gaertneriomyces semiglobifer]
MAGHVGALSIGAAVFIFSLIGIIALLGVGLLWKRHLRKERRPDEEAPHHRSHSVLITHCDTNVDEKEEANSVYVYPARGNRRSRSRKATRIKRQSFEHKHALKAMNIKDKHSCNGCTSTIAVQGAVLAPLMSDGHRKSIVESTLDIKYVEELGSGLVDLKRRSWMPTASVIHVHEGTAIPESGPCGTNAVVATVRPVSKTLEDQAGLTSDRKSTLKRQSSMRKSLVKPIGNRNRQRCPKQTEEGVLGDRTSCRESDPDAVRSSNIFEDLGCPEWTHGDDSGGLRLHDRTSDSHSTPSVIASAGVSHRRSCSQPDVSFSSFIASYNDATNLQRATSRTTATGRNTTSSDYDRASLERSGTDKSDASIRAILERQRAISFLARSSSLRRQRGDNNDSSDTSPTRAHTVPSVVDAVAILFGDTGRTPLKPSTTASGSLLDAIPEKPDATTSAAPEQSDPDGTRRTSELPMSHPGDNSS